MAAGDDLFDADVAGFAWCSQKRTKARQNVVNIKKMAKARLDSGLIDGNFKDEVFGTIALTACACAFSGGGGGVCSCSGGAKSLVSSPQCGQAMTCPAIAESNAI